MTDTVCKQECDTESRLPACDKSIQLLYIPHTQTEGWGIGNDEKDKQPNMITWGPGFQKQASWIWSHDILDFFHRSYSQAPKNETAETY